MSDCPSFERLVALWAGELDETEAGALDVHVFVCDPCAATTEQLAEIVGRLRSKMPFVISRAHHDRLVASGTRIHVTTAVSTLDRRPTTSARFTPDVDLLVFALCADVQQADRVDVEIASPSGTNRHVLQDVPFDREKGEVLIACQRHYEGMFPEGDPVFSVHAVERGKRRAVGDYRIEHVWR